MINIKHGALRTFKHDRLALGESAVQQQRRVADKGSQLFGSFRIFAEHFVGIERFGIEQCVRDHIFFAAGVLDVRAQQRPIEQIGDAQSAASHFVFISGPNAA